MELGDEHPERPRQGGKPKSIELIMWEFYSIASE